jgi:hypothetical protein
MPAKNPSPLDRLFAPLHRALGGGGGDTRTTHPALILGLACVLALGLSFALGAIFRSLAQSRARSQANSQSEIPVFPESPATAAAPNEPAPPPDPDEPPALTFNVTAGSLDDIARALSGQLGIRFGSDPNPPPDRYTFNIEGLSLWHVQQQLAAKHIVWNSPARVLKVSNTLDYWQSSPPRAGIGAFLSPASSQGSTDNPRYLATLALSVDPRLEVLKTQPPTFESATDDQSCTWQARPEVPRELTSFGSWDMITFQQKIILSRQFSPNANKAASLTSLRGAISVTQAQVSESLTISDPQNNLNTPVAGGPYEISLLARGTAAPAAPRGGRAGAGGPPASTGPTLTIRRVESEVTVDPSLPLNILITDNTETDWGMSSLPPGPGQTKSVAIPPNFPALEKLNRITVRFPTKTRQLSIPFEFKPVPLP